MRSLKSVSIRFIAECWHFLYYIFRFVVLSKFYILHLSGSSFLSLASFLYVDYVLLVAIILHQLLFTNPIFPTLPRKIPPIFPVNGVIVKELPYGKADSSYTFTPLTGNMGGIFRGSVGNIGFVNSS